MPELPEVETVRRGLAPHLESRRIVGARVREPRLRWPVPADLDARARGQRILALDRRGKYLLLQLETGWIICHLGMSGSLRLVEGSTPPARHDHLDLVLDHGQALRYRDPRRFGAMLWCMQPAQHPLIAPLGLEPLSDDLDGARLLELCQGRRGSIKALIMDAHRIAGIGNIYANEALFHAGIGPLLPARRLSRPGSERLAWAIKDTLARAIEAGGSSLRDFVDGHGNPGYFQQTYFVYGRADAPCRICTTPIRQIRQANRSSFYCPICQKC